MQEQENAVKTEEQELIEENCVQEEQGSLEKDDVQEVHGGAENNSVLEVYIKKLIGNKNRLCTFLLSILSAICSFLFLAEMKLNGITIIFTLGMMVSAITNAVYAVDVDRKNRYSHDMVVCGAVFCLLGMVLRTFRMGILFSVQYFIAYLIFSIVFVLLILKLSKNQGKEKTSMIMLAVIAVYDLIEFFLSGYANLGIIWKIYHISEMLLFISFIFILKMQSKEESAFSEKVGKYKKQIPSAKICILILVFVAAVSFAIGCIKEVNTKKKTSVTQISTKTVEVEKTPEQEKPVENKASGTVSGGETTAEAVPSAETTPVATTAQAEPKPITLGETVVSEQFEFTLNKVELSYDVEPDNPPSYYTHYAAAKGQVYIYVNASIKNTGKHSLECDEIYSVIADYNNGYTYRGFNIASDYDGDFTYANITSVEPLQTLGVHCLVDCPQEVEESENPLSLKIVMNDGTVYSYTVR